MRFGNAERADRLALDHLRQPVALLLFGPEGQDISRDEIGVDQKAGTACPDAPQFLIDNRVEQIVEAKPAIFFGHRTAQHAGFAGLQPELARDNALLFPLVVDGYDFLFHELASAIAPHFMFFRSEEHTSELQSLMRISYDVFCLKKQTK